MYVHIDIKYFRMYKVTDNGLEDGSFIGRQVDLGSFFGIHILCKRLPVKLFAVRAFQ